MVVIDSEGDFASVIDGLQAVTLNRAVGGTVAVDAARLVRRVTRSIQPASGGVIVDDLVWDLALPSGEAPIEVGDELQHSAGEGCVVLEVERLGASGRYRCTTREVAVSAQVGVLVELQSPVWEDLGSGPEITGWTTLAADVPAHIQPAAVEHDHDAEPTASEIAFTVSLSAVDDLSRCEKVVAADGAEYRVDRIVDEGRIDGLPVLEVTRTLAAA